MNLLLYVPKKNRIGEQLAQIIETIFPEGPIDILRTFQQLVSRIRQPLNDRDVMVLLLPTRKHLVEILAIAPLLERLRLIAILPDPDPETVSRGHLLRPRFLTIVDQRLEDLAAVLKKMGETHPFS